MNPLYFTTKKMFKSAALALLLGISSAGFAQDYWHGKPRKIHYTPDGGDFVTVNGNMKFNRALYGYPSSFRTEAGDLPEFAFYLPGIGGNLRFGVVREEKELWLTDATNIEARYRAGSMHYKINDPAFGNGHITLTAMPMRKAEGAIFKVQLHELPADMELVWVYGGVSGKKYSRSGDLGADPRSVFDLTPDKCATNEFSIAEDNTFELHYGSGKAGADKPKILGAFPKGAQLNLADATNLESIKQLFDNSEGDAPVIMGKIKSGNQAQYLAIYQPGFEVLSHENLEEAYQQADKDRKELAERVLVNTPDPFINTLGGALGIAADAIYDAPAYVHGAVAWRMPLPGWRGAYVADWMGWHDRAKTHFSGYLESQYLEPDGSRNDPDPEKHLARQIEKTGKSIFNKGYLSRRPGKPSAPHHYDMNQVFFDQLIRHFDWTGDVDYLREVWPGIQRHLDWEKRNFDPDGDGLYNAYASIWASDALQYNSGGVAHASAYNYFANLKAAELAKILSEDPQPYQAEAEKILKASNQELWLADKGHYAEYKDFLGPQNVHPQAGVWSVYHVMDCEVPDPFHAYQLTRYVDEEIPHIPLMAEGMPEGKFHTLSTTNWMPYTWSVNNVALAEVLHTSLAYWQAGNQEEAFRLFKSAILESMYLGGSPGNFQQLSFLDAMRSELYRDFADAVGMGARSLIEGLFGVKPDLLHDKVKIQPGFPADWEHASLSTPDLSIAFQREGNTDQYQVQNRFGKEVELLLQVTAFRDEIAGVKVNGKAAKWKLVENHVGMPQVLIQGDLSDAAKVEIEWAGAPIRQLETKPYFVPGEKLTLGGAQQQILAIKDPQSVLRSSNVAAGKSTAEVNGKAGYYTVFAQTEQGQLTWWQPVAFDLKPAFEIIAQENQKVNSLAFTLVNRKAEPIKGKVLVNGQPLEGELSLAAQEEKNVEIDRLDWLKTGTNEIKITHGGDILAEGEVINWNIQKDNSQLEPINMTSYFNDKVTRIFRNEYLSPRSPYPTLQIPIQGMGDWASFGAYMDIDDAGLRSLAGEEGLVRLPQGIAFQTPRNPADHNILFASLWDNYPDTAKLPLSGKASHAYLLMAGSTNHMQSRLENGQVIIHYKDGTQEVLSLRNPESWWPIEQDYFIDGHSFETGAPRPIRVHLKTGKITDKAHDNYVSINHFTNYAIDGGAATVLDLPLDRNKELEAIEVKATTIEVVIGLMAVTLER